MKAIGIALGMPSTAFVLMIWSTWTEEMTRVSLLSATAIGLVFAFSMGLVVGNVLVNKLARDIAETKSAPIAGRATYRDVIDAQRLETARDRTEVGLVRDVLRWVGSKPSEPDVYNAPDPDIRPMETYR